MKMSKFDNAPQTNYLQFLQELNGGILDQKNFDLPKSLQHVFDLENEFRRILSSTKKGEKVYDDFIYHILEVEKNILAARVFFREREDTFSKLIPNEIRSNNSRGLMNFSINYKFMYWAVNTCDVPHKKRLQKIMTDLIKARQHIVEQCLPLIINRSRLFQVKTRKFNNDAMEFIQSATEGFMSAIDKYVPPATDKFRGVAVGWIQSKLMADYSDSYLKLSLKEKRVLYRANIAIYRHGIKDMKEVLKFVHESYPDVKKTDLESLIVSMGSIASIDTMNHDVVTHQSTEYDANAMENDIIHNDSVNKLYDAMLTLLVVERKVIKLKGGLS